MFFKIAIGQVQWSRSSIKDWHTGTRLQLSTWPRLSVDVQWHGSSDVNWMHTFIPAEDLALCVAIRDLWPETNLMPIL